MRVRLHLDVYGMSLGNASRCRMAMHLDVYAIYKSRCLWHVNTVHVNGMSTVPCASTIGWHPFRDDASRKHSVTFVLIHKL